MNRYDPPFPRHYNSGEPFQWRKEQLVDVVRWTAERLNSIADNLGQTWDYVADWTPGVPSVGLEGGSGGPLGDDGAKNGRTPHLALRNVSEGSSAAAVDFNIVALAMVRVAPVVGRAAAAHDRLRVADPSEDVMEYRTRARPGEGDCGNPACNHYCTGTKSDRRVNGRCPACLTYRSRTGQERPHKLVHRTLEDGCRLCKRDELLAQGHDPNDVVALVDEQVRR